MLKIKEEFKRLIPELTPEEFKQLETNCMEEGIREKIITWNGYIIDGHNRYHIAQKWDLEYETESKYFDSEYDVIDWMILNQLGRRNITPPQRDYLIGQKQQNEKLKVGKPTDKLRQNVGISTSERIAKEFGTNARQVERNEKFAQGVDKTSPELKQQILQGTAKVNKGDLQVIAKAEPAFVAQTEQDIIAKANEIKKRKAEEKKEKQRIEREKLAEIGKEKSIDVDFRLGDFEEVFADIPDGSVDCIITDPPYPKEFIECWSKLSRFAKRVLKPNGYCIAYSGQMNLPEVINRMSEHLDYYWIFSLMHTGNRQLINGRGLFCGWKPILIFQNGFKKNNNPFDDFINGSGIEKSLHKWQQSELELNHLIENFTNVGDLICEPFAGSGTTIVAALKANRNIIASEINEESYNISKQRISEWKN